MPVVLTDFSSQYPTINSLLGNPEIFNAAWLSFEDVTDEIRGLVERITLDDCFDSLTWKALKFFARIRPDNDVVPVRAEYTDDGVTKNIGVNYFTSNESIWLSGPDVIASKPLAGRVPRIEKAIRMVPYGQQKGLRPISLRGMVDVDPRTDDLFRVMVEQKQVYKDTNPALSYFLKICANSTSYGMFYELTPQKQSEPVDWLHEAWHWILEGEIAAPRPAPPWLANPAMMRMTVSTPVLGILKGFTQPFNFVHVPLLFPNLFPPGRDPSNFGLVLPFSKHRDRWLYSNAWDTHSGEEYSIRLLGTETDAGRVEMKCYGNILGAYREHPEAKFLGHGGNPCNSLTRGLLTRRHIIAGHHRYIGKETSRRWEQGDDLAMVDFACAEYSEGQTVANNELRKRIARYGLKRIARETGIDRNTVRLIVRGKSVKSTTLAQVITFIENVTPPSSKLGVVAAKRKSVPRSS